LTKNGLKNCKCNEVLHENTLKPLMKELLMLIHSDFMNGLCRKSLYNTVEPLNNGHHWEPKFCPL